MSVLDLLAVLSLVASGASLVLAVVTIFYARASQKDARASFAETQKLMAEQYERTKGVLTEIDKRSAVTDRTVRDTQEKMLSTITTIINETVIPKKADMGEQFGLAFIQMMMQDPAKAGQVLEKMKPLVEMGRKGKDAGT